MQGSEPRGEEAAHACEPAAGAAMIAQDLQAALVRVKVEAGSAQSLLSPGGGASGEGNRGATEAAAAASSGAAHQAPETNRTENLKVSPERATKRQKVVLPEGAGPHMLRCVVRWQLGPPYDLEAPDALWAAYYVERAALEFREANFFDGDGNEPRSFPQCYSFQKCSKTPSVPGSAGEPGKKCGVCGKARGNYVQLPAALRRAWTETVASDEGLPDDLQLPPMQPHCRESYASDCHESGTTKGQYQDFAGTLRERVARTLASSPGFDSKSAATAASSVMVLSYWVNYEEAGVGAQARTVEFSTRLYSPSGTGTSVDLSWYRHFRMRNTIAPEKYSTLHAKARKLRDACPGDPARAFDWRNAKEEYGVMALGCLDGDTDERNVSKTFATLVPLRQLRSLLFGPSAKISPRKVFGLLSRAAGAHVVNEEAGWLYMGMRERYELLESEQSDGEEHGNPDGDDGGCAIM